MKKSNPICAYLKVSKSRKQFMVFSILPKNERNSLSWASFLLRIVIFAHFFWRIQETINCFRDLLTFSTSSQSHRADCDSKNNIRTQFEVCWVNPDVHKRKNSCFYPETFHFGLKFWVFLLVFPHYQLHFFTLFTTHIFLLYLFMLSITKICKYKKYKKFMKSKLPKRLKLGM